MVELVLIAGLAMKRNGCCYREDFEHHSGHFRRFATARVVTAVAVGLVHHMRAG